jgi:hypothetical protein
VKRRSLIALLFWFSAQPLFAESPDHEKLVLTANYAMSMQTEATSKRCRVPNGSERVRSITERLKAQKPKLEDELGKEAVHEIFSLRGYYDGNLLLLEMNCRKNAKLKPGWEIWVVAFDDAVNKLSGLLEQR